MAKIFKKYRKQTFSTLGHHHLVSKMFGFYLFNILAYFLNLSKLYKQFNFILLSLFFKPMQTLWRVVSILVPVSL